MYDNRKKDSQASKKNKTKAEVAAEKAINGYKSIKDLYPWKTEWITTQADKDLTYFAEKLGKTLADKNYGLTNSKIRSIYGEIKRIQTSGYEKQKPSFYLLRPKMAYAAGRELENAGVQLFKLFFEDAWKEVQDEKTFKNFCNLIEAVLAYHKAYGGKD